MSQGFYNAVTAIEDQHFEEHWGIDFPRIASAHFASCQAPHHRRRQHISMQPPESFPRSERPQLPPKMQEMLLALQIERRYTKPQFLRCTPISIPGPRKLWLRRRRRILFRQAGH